MMNIDETYEEYAARCRNEVEATIKRVIDESGAQDAIDAEHARCVSYHANEVMRKVMRVSKGTYNPQTVILILRELLR